MIGKIIFIGFIIFRIYSWVSKTNAKNTHKTSPNTQKKYKGLDDVLGDFMKQIQQKSEPVLVNTDTHKAESDSNKKLDWQKVTTSKFADKNKPYKREDSHKKFLSTEEITPINTSEDNTPFEFEEIDLRKAVLYKDILNRKYFTV